MKLIDTIILLTSCIIDIYLLHNFYDFFFLKRAVFKESKLLLNFVNVITVLLNFLINILGNAEINLVLNSVIIVLYFVIVFYGSFGNKIIYLIMAFSILWGSELLFAMIFKLGNEQYKEMSQIPLILLVSKMLTFIIFIAVEQLIGKKKKKMNNKVFLKYICLPLASFGLMSGMFYSNIDFSASLNLQLLMTFCFVLIFLGNILMFYEFNRYSEEMNDNVEKQVLIARQQADLTHYMQVAENQDLYNELVHNTCHYIRVIHDFANQKDYKSIMEIVNKLDNQLEESELVLYSCNHVLNAVLSEKREQAENSDVEFDVYVEPGIDLSMIENIDLIAMLGNLLDNALRAASECKENRKVWIRIYMQDIGGFCIIKIVNSYIGQIKLMEDNFLTTKTDEGMHGLGIQSVKRMAAKYGGYLMCKVKEKTFDAVLLLSTDV